MGYDAQNTLENGTKPSDVEEFLQIIGFERTGPTKLGDTHAVAFWHYGEADYERFQGLSALLYTQGDLVHVDTRTAISRNKADCEVHNSTLRHLRKRFGGHFVSDYGRNRYFPWEGISREGAEAGCYLAYWRFKNHFAPYRIYTTNRRFNNAFRSLPEAGILDPMVISNNFLIPFLVSIIEDYYKSSYKALLRFSDRKTSVLRGYRIQADELIDENMSPVAVEDAVVRFMSFQNLPKVTRYFNEMNPRVDIHACLKRPYRRRKMSLYESMSRLIEVRHDFIHRAKFDPSLDESNMKRLVDDVQAAIKRVYEHLIDVHSWQANDHD